MYAAYGAAEYWLVDLVRREVLVHTGPLASGEWGRVTRHVAGDRLGLPGVDAVVEVTEIIGEDEEHPAATDAERGDATDAH